MPEWPDRDGILAEPAGELRADVVVVGSGPGGSTTACPLAEAGRNVLLVEEGPLLRLVPRIAFTREEMVEKYRHGGVTVAMGPTKVAYVEGRCVGGGSEINSGLYHRTPDEILDLWRREFLLEGLDDLAACFDACEADVSVSPAPEPFPPPSARMQQGARKLGWSSLEVPRWYKYDEDGNGTEPPRGLRQTMTETMIPRFLTAGGQLLADATARRLRQVGRRWRVSLVHQPANGPRRRIEVDAQSVFVCCGAIHTPALLRRSGITRNIGNALGLHPTVKVVAEFDEPVNPPGMGVPSHQVKQFSPRIGFGCSISSLPYLALALLDQPDGPQQAAERWQRMAVYYAMNAGGGTGSIRNLPGFADPLVRYRLADQDYTDLGRGLVDLCRLLFEAGAKTLYPCLPGARPLQSIHQLDQLPVPLPKGSNLMTVHLFSSCPMGERRSRCAADSFGRVHDADGLYLADASLLCTPPGVNPQGSIMGFARRNALRFLKQL